MTNPLVLPSAISLTVTLNGTSYAITGDPTKVSQLLTNYNQAQAALALHQSRVTTVTAQIAALATQITALVPAPAVAPAPAPAVAPVPAAAPSILAKLGNFLTGN